jgi:protein ImuB
MLLNTPRSKGFLTAGKQPSLLLPSPIPLTTRYQKPVYISPLTLIQGPERIETRWWTGQDIQRDYYIARNMQGMSLWIFRDIKLSRELATPDSCWFLQGLFA